MSTASRTAAAAVSLACAFALAGLSRLAYDATARNSPLLSGRLRSDSPNREGGTAVVATEEGDVALIRLSWRTTSERVEQCRRLTEDELEALPVHMRREEVCEGRLVPYRLRVTLDDRVVVDEIVRPAGARGDRPLYVFRELAVPAGEQVLTVVWQREGQDRTAREGREKGDGIVGMDEPHAADEAIGIGDQRPAEPVRGSERHPTVTSARRGDGDNGGNGTPAVLGLRALLALEPRDVALITYDVDVRSLVARGRGILDFESSSRERVGPEPGDRPFGQP